jgi:hypothetical protein
MDEQHRSFCGTNDIIMATIPDIAPFRDKLAELDAQMADPNFYADQRRAAEVSREHQHVSGLIERFEAFHRAQKQIAENQSLLEDATLEAGASGDGGRRGGELAGGAAGSGDRGAACDDSARSDG